MSGNVSCCIFTLINWSTLSRQSVCKVIHHIRKDITLTLPMNAHEPLVVADTCGVLRYSQSVFCATARYDDVRFVDFLIIDITTSKVPSFFFPERFLGITKGWRRLQQSPRPWLGLTSTQILVLVFRRKSDNLNLSSTSTLRPHEQWAWEPIFWEDALRKTILLVSKRMYNAKGRYRINASQFLGAPLYLINQDWYNAWIAFTKQSWGLLTMSMTQSWAPTIMRVSGDKNVRGQLLQTLDGNLLCDFPERLVMIANHQVNTIYITPKCTLTYHRYIQTGCICGG